LVVFQTDGDGRAFRQRDEAQRPRRQRGGVQRPEADADPRADQRQHRRAVRDGGDLARHDAGLFERVLHQPSDRPARGGLQQHQVLVRERRDRRRARLGERVAVRDEHAEPRLRDPPLGEPRSRRRATDQPDVQPVGAQQLQDVRGRAGVVDLQLEVRVLPAQHLHERDEVVGREARVEAHPDLPVLARARVARQEPGVLDRAERRAAGAQERRARVGQLDRAVVAVEQADAEVLLQVHDLLADGGLGDEQPRRRAAIAQLLGHRDERRQPAQFHVSSLR